jgi:hypothetical protein
LRIRSGNEGAGPGRRLVRDRRVLSPAPKEPLRRARVGVREKRGGDAGLEPRKQTEAVRAGGDIPGAFFRGVGLAQGLADRRTPQGLRQRGAGPFPELGQSLALVHVEESVVAHLLANLDRDGVPGIPALLVDLAGRFVNGAHEGLSDALARPHREAVAEVVRCVDEVAGALVGDGLAAAGVAH